MKKTLQKVECSIEAGTKQISGQLRQDYSRCTGVFFINSADDQLTMRMTIAGQEVFPSGTNVSLFNFNGNYSRDEAKYDLTKEMIPAKSSEYQIDFENKSGVTLNAILYFELAND
jgi:hypothetical protein